MTAVCGARCRAGRSSPGWIAAGRSPPWAAIREADGVLEIETPQGLARAHVRPAEEPRAMLVLGHGAGGSVNAPDLVAAAGVALDEGVTVALVEQPYRVAGGKSPPPAPRLDGAGISIVGQLPLDGLPLIAGGRSSGARVACRT